MISATFDKYNYFLYRHPMKTKKQLKHEFQAALIYALEVLKKDKKLNQKQLAKQIGRSQQHISGIIIGKSKASETVKEQIADILGTKWTDMHEIGEILMKESRNEAISYDDERKKREFQKLIRYGLNLGGKSGSTNSDFITDLTVLVPFFNIGKGEPLTDEGFPVGQALYQISVPKLCADNDSFAIALYDDALIPEEKKGSIAVVSPMRPVGSGDICLAVWPDNGRRVVRVYNRYSSGMVILRAKNPDRKQFPDIEIDPHEAREVRFFKITFIGKLYP